MLTLNAVLVIVISILYFTAAKHESDLDNLAVEETSTAVSTTTSTLKPTAAPRLPCKLFDNDVNS